MITQKVDPADPLLAFVTGWINALASRVEHLDVLCLEQPAVVLPANVTAWSMGKERGRNRLRELVAFYQVLNRVINNVDVIFCHMIPRFAVLAAPYATIFRKPLILWYIHRQADLELRLAVTACRYVATAVSDGFPVRTPKLRPLGHGIDADFFAPNPNCQPDDPPLIVQVARLTSIKHQETLLRALAMDVNARVAFVGAVPPGHDQTYLAHLQALANELKIADKVTFTGALKQQAVREMYWQASVAVNLSPPGLFDKAALESMLTAVPTIVTNPAFDPLLGDYASRLRIVDSNDVAGLANSLKSLSTMTTAERQSMVDGIRQRVNANHSLEGMMDRLVALMESTLVI